jgi:hypothetical protein
MSENKETKQRRSLTRIALDYWVSPLNGLVFLGVLALGLLLSSCQTSTKPVVVEQRIQTIKRLHPPPPPPVVPVKIKIQVLTPQVTAVLNSEIEEGNKFPYVFFAMSEQDYLTLARWQQDVLRWMQQAAQLIEFYKNNEDEVK